jgi:N-succinyldiaminopimelate aminotransferase
MTFPRLTPKLAPFGTSIFAEMSALAVATNSINLGQGFPDVDGPNVVAEAAVEAIRTGKGNQYPPGPGIEELRHAIADHQRAYYGIELDPDAEVLVTCGATEGLASVLLSFLDAGDEAILFEPFYDSYAPCVALAIEHDLLVVSDEAYEHLTYDGVAHVPISTLPGMFERTLTVGSAAKTLSFTGWKVGWVTGPAELVAGVRRSKQFLTYVSSGPFQYAVAVGLARPRSDVEAFAADLGRRREILLAGLGRAGFTTFRPSGTYFVTADVSSVTSMSGIELCRQLPARCGVVAIPNEVFYARPEHGRSLVRFAFCKRDEVLVEAVDRLRTLTF